MPSKTGKATSYPLRLPLTVRREIEALARSEGISINQLISLAVAEKIVRCQQQTVLDHAADVNSPTRRESNRIQQLETHALLFGASFELESAQHQENLVALGMPVTFKKSAD
jgi:hypothetical protein